MAGALLCLPAMRWGIPSQRFALSRAQLELIARSLVGRSPGVDAVEALEHAAAARLGALTAVATDSHATALVVALMVLGVSRGDRVVVPDYGSPGMLAALAKLGATPVVVPTDPDRLTLAGKAELAAELEAAAAAIVCHAHGQLAAIDGIVAACAGAGVPLIEDAWHAFGAGREGRAAGTFGDLGVFGVDPESPLASLDGGLVVTARETRAQALDTIVLAPAAERPDPGRIGEALGRFAISTGRGLAAAGLGAALALGDRLPQPISWLAGASAPPVRAATPRRLDALSAAVAGVSLGTEPATTEARRAWAAELTEGLAGLPESSFQRFDRKADNTFAGLAMKVAPGAAAALGRRCLKRGVGTRADRLVRVGSGPWSWDEEVLLLPAHQGMTQGDAHRIIRVVREEIVARASLD